LGTPAKGWGTQQSLVFEGFTTMPIDSIHTNIGAMVALQSLDQTATALQTTEKQVSTGYRVADAVDNGAAYAVAQNVRSSVAALTSANEQLGNVQGMLSTTLTGLNSASNEMITMRALLVKLADGSSTAIEKTEYLTEYHSDLANLKSFFEDSTYNGKTLLSNFAAYSSGFGSFGVVRNEIGMTYHVAYYSTSQVFSQLCFGVAANTLATHFAQFIQSNGTFNHMQNTIGTWLNDVGAQVQYINNQISYNSNKIDALNAGLGSLVDADLAAESAQLTALQIRQQLGEQSLSIANSAPNMLLTLFR
jgi:flagellin